MAQSLGQKTLKNSAWNTTAFFAGIFFSVFVTPYVVHRVGVAPYGLLILANTIISIMSLLELGMGSSLIKMISERAELGDYGEVQRQMGSMLFLNALIGLVGTAVFFVLAWFGAGLFKVPPADAASVRLLFYIGAGTFFLSCISTSFGAVLPALQRYDILSKISVANLVVLNLATAAVVWRGFGVTAILLLQLISNACVLILYMFYTKKYLPAVKIRLHADLRKLSPITNFGFFIFVKNISTQALTHFDKVLVSSFLGPAAVSFYGLPGSIPIKTVGITQSLTDILFPLTSSLAAQGSEQKIKEIYPRVMRNIILLSAGCTAAIILFGKLILLYWLGQDFVVRSAFVLYFLAMTYFLLAVYAPVASFLLGLGKPKLPAIGSVVMFALNMIFLIFLLPAFHIKGAAVAYFLSVLAVPAIIFIFERNYLHLEGIVRFYLTLFAKLAATSVAYYALCRYVLLPLVTNLYALIIVGPLAVLLYFGLYWLFGFMEQEDQVAFKNFLNAVFKKLTFRA